MTEQKEPKADWIHLPETVQEISLWTCLHDGELISCKSDPLECVATLECKVGHLSKDNPTTFLLRLENVTSVRAIGHFRFVGKFEEPENISELERKILAGKHLIWREETLSFSEFEAALKTDPLQITDANYVCTNAETTLRFGGFLDGEKFDDIYFDVFLSGGKLSASRSDGREFGLEKLIALGDEYWDARAKGRIQHLERLD